MVQCVYYLPCHKDFSGLFTLGSVGGQVTWMWRNERRPELDCDAVSAALYSSSVGIALAACRRWHHSCHLISVATEPGGHLALSCLLWMTLNAVDRSLCWFLISQSRSSLLVWIFFCTQSDSTLRMFVLPGIRYDRPRSVLGDLIQMNGWVVLKY